MSVTLTLIPSASAPVIAGRPAAVAGIFTSRFSRAIWCHSCRAWATVAAASCASRGSTSMETLPSTPSVAAWTPASSSQASCTSRVVSASAAVSASAPWAASSATASA